MNDAILLSMYLRDISIMMTIMPVVRKRYRISILRAELNVSGFTTAAAPRISSILKMFEPIILPTAMSGLLLRKATMLVISSGKDVPVAMIVIAMSFSDTFILLAMLTALLVVISPP